MDFALSEEQRAVRDLARDFAAREIAPFVRDYDREGSYPRQNSKRLAELGLLGGGMPTEWGGSGLDYLTLMLILEELAYVCSATAMACGQASCSLGEGLLRYGTDDQRERYLRPYLAGDLVAAVAVTEPHSGTDIARRIESTAQRTAGGYTLNGTKVWVSNCVNADWFLTFATLDKTKGARSTVAFVVQRDWEGVSVNRFANSVGCRSMASGEVVFQDVFVPTENLVGDETNGNKVLLSGSEIGRLACAARAVGLLRACLDASVQYAKEREVFDAPIGRYQLIQTKIADMRVAFEAARLLVWQLAWLKDQGHERLQKEASVAKLFATDAVAHASAEAVQIFGAYGCSDEYPVGRFFRDAKFMQIYDGTNEIHRVLIAEHELGYRRRPQPEQSPLAAQAG